MRIKTILAIIVSVLIVAGMYYSSIFLTSLAAVLGLSGLMYLDSRSSGFKKVFEDIVSTDPLKILSKKIFTIKPVQAVELNLAEGIDSPSYQSFSFGTPGASATVTHFPLCVGDIDLGFFKVYSTRDLSSNERSFIEEISYQVVSSLLISNLRQEILRFKKLSEQNQKARTGFLANLSHELRGPLGNISNACEIILEMNNLDEIKEMASIAVNNSKHLITLINDILEYARSQSAQTANKEAFEVIQALKECCDLLRSFAAQRKVKIQFGKMPEQPVFIFCDKKHFRQICMNLLSNAIKYNREGGSVEVTCVIEQRRVRISFQDTGYGIPAEFMPHLFEPFQRAQNQIVEKQTGTGLGLALVKRLVELNDGFIEVESEENVGSTFSIAFPITHERPASAVDKTEVEVRGSGVMLLLVESLKESSLSFVKFLAQRRFSLGFFNTLEELLTNVNTTNAQCVLVDEKFFKRFADDLFPVLRATPNGKHIPVVFVSSNSFDFEIEADLKKGFDLVLTQPFDMKQAAAKILEVISHK